MSQGGKKIATMRWKTATEAINQQQKIVNVFKEKSENKSMWRRPSEAGAVSRDPGDQGKRDKLFGLDEERYMRSQHLETANERNFAQMQGHFHGSSVMNGQVLARFDTEEALLNLKSKVRSAAYSSVRKAADLRALYKRHTDNSQEGDGMMGSHELMAMLQKLIKGEVNEEAAARLLAKITRRRSNRISERMFVNFFKMPKYATDNIPVREFHGAVGDHRANHDSRRPLSAMARLKAKIVAKAKGLDLQDYFKQFDTDRDGLITKREMRFVLHHMLPGQISDDTVECLMQQVDVDGSGEIDFCELADFIHGRTDQRRRSTLNRERVKFANAVYGATKALSIQDLHAQMTRVKADHKVQKHREGVNNKVKAKLEKGVHALRDYRPALHKADFACIAGKSDGPNASTGKNSEAAWRVVPVVHDISGCKWSPMHTESLSASRSEPLVRATGGALTFPGAVEADTLAGSWKPGDEVSRLFGFEMDQINWPQLISIKSNIDAQLVKTGMELKAARAEFQTDFTMHTDRQRLALDNLGRDFGKLEESFEQLNQYLRQRAKRDGGSQRYSLTRASQYRCSDARSVCSSVSTSGASARRSSGAQLRCDGSVVRFNSKDLAAAQRKVGFNMSKATRCSTTSTLTRLSNREKYMTAQQFKETLVQQFSLRLPPSEFAALFHHFDRDGNGQVMAALFIREARAYEQMRGLASTQCL
jgi:Ca2+-binding EF-hand superfamily protein